MHHRKNDLQCVCLQVEAMKHAFALRLSLGDPGVDDEFLDLSQILEDMLAEEFIGELR